MIPFNDLHRWNSRSIIDAAEALEAGRCLPHLGHIHDQARMAEVLRRAGRLLESAQERSRWAALLMWGRGWGFRVEGDLVRVKDLSGRLYEDEERLRIEAIMGELATMMASALEDAAQANDELFHVRAEVRQDPSERVRPGVWRPHRAVTRHQACRDHRHDRRPTKGCAAP